MSNVSIGFANVLKAKPQDPTLGMTCIVDDTFWIYKKDLEGNPNWTALIKLEDAFVYKPDSVPTGDWNIAVDAEREVAVVNLYAEDGTVVESTFVQNSNAVTVTPTTADAVVAVVYYDNTVVLDLSVLLPPVVSVNADVSGNIDATDPTITLSPFTVEDGEDTHVATEYQIVDGTDQVVWSTQTTDTNLTSIMAEVILDFGATYKFKARVQGERLGWSEWGEVSGAVSNEADAVAPSSPESVDLSSGSYSTTSSVDASSGLVVSSTETTAQMSAGEGTEFGTLYSYNVDISNGEYVEITENIS